MMFRTPNRMRTANMVLFTRLRQPPWSRFLKIALLYQLFRPGSKSWRDTTTRPRSTEPKWCKLKRMYTVWNSREKRTIRRWRSSSDLFSTFPGNSYGSSLMLPCAVWLDRCGLKHDSMYFNGVTGTILGVYGMDTIVLHWEESHSSAIIGRQGFFFPVSQTAGLGLGCLDLFFFIRSIS